MHKDTDHEAHNKPAALKTVQTMYPSSKETPG